MVSRCRGIRRPKMNRECLCSERPAFGASASLDFIHELHVSAGDAEVMIVCTGVLNGLDAGCGERGDRGAAP